MFGLFFISTDFKDCLTRQTDFPQVLAQILGQSQNPNRELLTTVRKLELHDKIWNLRQTLFLCPAKVILHDVAGQPQARQAANILDGLHIVVPARVWASGG